MKVLVVEDRQEKIQPILDGMTAAGYELTFMDTFKKGEIMMLSKQYAITLISEHLCDCKRISQMRQRGYSGIVAVIIGRLQVSKVVELLNQGIDDVYDYGMDMHLILSKIKSFIRRSQLEYQETYALGQVIFNPRNSLLIKGDDSLSLTRKERDLLMYFYLNQNMVLSKERLRYVVWGNKDCEGNNIEVHISYIRKKLKLMNSSVRIETKRNMGYMLKTT